MNLEAKRQAPMNEHTPYRLDWINLDGEARWKEFHSLTEAIRLLKVIPGPRLWLISRGGYHVAGEDNYAEQLATYSQGHPTEDKNEKE